MTRNGHLGDDAASVAPSKGVSDISGIELGSALGEQHQVRSGRHMSRVRMFMLRLHSTHQHSACRVAAAL
jgi:hypothetical protein